MNAPPGSDEHRSHQLLAYLEDLLDREERGAVDRHLADCPGCSDQLSQLRHTVQWLRDRRGAFCPEPWQWYAFLNYTEARDPLLAEHVERCDKCREICASLEREAGAQELPARLRNELTGLQHAPDRMDRVVGAGDEGFWERVRSWFKVPMLAAGAVAAVLLVVFLLPRDIPQSVAALSSVAWESSPRPKGVVPGADRLAVVLRFRDFPAAVGQGEVDALYEAMAPPMELASRVQVVAPGDLNRLASRGFSRPRSLDDVLNLLQTGLDTRTAIIVTVKKVPDGYLLQADRRDLSTGTNTGSGQGRADSVTDLSKRVRELFLQVALSGGQADSRE